MSKTVLCFLGLLFISVFGHSSLIRANETVKISVLSKYIRYLKKGRITKIVLSLPKGTEGYIKKESDGKFQKIKTDADNIARDLVIKYRDGQYQLMLDNTSISNFNVLVFNPHSPEKFFLCKIKDINRIYPLPFEIKMVTKVPELMITSDLNQYAMDSARAELGFQDIYHSEAVMALALLIKARGKFIKSRQRKNHTNFDFCDLTHCQVYTGHLESKMSMDSPEIDISSLDFMPLFHSSCGGQTFGRGVFYLNDGNFHKVKDWLLGSKKYLCRGRESKWRREILFHELVDILKPTKEAQVVNLNMAEQETLVYDREKLIIKLKYDGKIFQYAPETFRLRVNRNKGWNFIRSNNYTVRIRRSTEGEVVHLSGYGMGHGVGLCQVGALNLANKGFSRFEILKHFFPQITFLPEKNAKELFPSDLSFITFSLRSGNIKKISYPAFQKYQLPLGSVNKILVYLYLILYRQDLLKDYRYFCHGSEIFLLDDAQKKAGKKLKIHCWQKKGHGLLNIDDALARSCNLFFLSLYRFIDYDQYLHFFSSFTGKIGMQSPVWPFKLPEDKLKNFAGLDFKYRFKLQDLIKLVQFLSLKESNDPRINELIQVFPREKLEKLQNALRNTYISGTAHEANSHLLNKKTIRDPITLCLKKLNQKNIIISKNKLWGKTSTIIHGSNQLISHGLFIGGNDKTGIITLVRGSNGQAAALWAKCLLNITHGQYK